jgi:NAD(P)-dependent dehydrogenase (short-subunit alcohol dehydrogenase family)
MKPGATTPDAGATIVSGAAGAVGGAIARHLAERGARLVLPTRSDPDALTERFPTATVLAADLLDPGDARRVAEVALERHGAIDALLNVAGGFAMGSALAATLEDLEPQLDVNLRTAVRLTGACLGPMTERGAGTVIAVSAGAAARGGRAMGAYAASKAALEGYLRSVRAEVEPHGVGVSLLVPEGTIDTSANREAMPDADRSGWIDPLALAEAASFLLARGARGRVDELRIRA